MTSINQDQIQAIDVILRRERVFLKMPFQKEIKMDSFSQQKTQNILFFLFIYSHVYTLFGSFLPPPRPLAPPPHFQAEPVLPF
jgi:hypothetical protein